jgi:hypothetical protein
MLLRSLTLSGTGAERTSRHAPNPLLDLSDYRLERTFALPAADSPAAAVTYNRDRGTLFVFGDACDGLVEVTRSGAVVSTMSLHGFGDTEGITYIGDGRFVLTEKRLRSAYLLQYAAGGWAERSSLPAVSLGAAVANVHRVEGISAKSPNASYPFGERSSRAAYVAGFDFGADTAAVGELFARAADESDVQVLSVAAPLPGIPHRDGRVMNRHGAVRQARATGAGAVLNAFDFSAAADPTAGIVIDASGAFHFAEQFSRLHVPTPVSEPASIVLMAADQRLLVCRRHAAGRHRGSSRRHESFTKRSRSRPSIG